MAKSTDVLMIVVAITLCSGLLVSGCSSTPNCEEEILQQSVSPDRKSLSVVFQRNCGATTAYVTHVNIRSLNKDFVRDNGVILEGQVLLSRSRVRVTTDWLSSSELRIRCEGCQKNELPRSTQEWRGIKVNYSD